MTIKVDLDDLPAVLARYPWGFLVTVTDDARPRFLAVAVTVEDGALVAPIGATATANIDAGRGAAFAFPSPEPHEMSLMVDGDATVEAGRVHLRPTSAMLHRPALAG